MPAFLHTGLVPFEGKLRQFQTDPKGVEGRYQRGGAVGIRRRSCAALATALRLG
jgi:hypothetical protein